MNDGVETSQFAAVGKYQRRELGAIDAAVCFDDACAKFAKDFVVRGLAGLDYRVGEGIGVEHGEAHLAQHRGNRAFTAGDSAGQAESEHARFHRAPALCGVAAVFEMVRRRRAALTVLLMSMVMS